MNGSSPRGDEYPRVREASTLVRVKGVVRAVMVRGDDGEAPYHPLEVQYSSSFLSSGCGCGGGQRGTTSIGYCGVTSLTCFDLVVTCCNAFCIWCGLGFVVFYIFFSFDCFFIFLDFFFFDQCFNFCLIFFIVYLRQFGLLTLYFLMHYSHFSVLFYHFLKFLLKTVWVIHFYFLIY